MASEAFWPSGMDNIRAGRSSGIGYTITRDCHAAAFEIRIVGASVFRTQFVFRRPEGVIRSHLCSTITYAALSMSGGSSTATYSKVWCKLHKKPSTFST